MPLTDDLWEKIAAALVVHLVEKNERIWLNVWRAVAARSWLTSHIEAKKETDEGFTPPELEDVIELRYPDAKGYFLNHGTEFVKELTDTDLNHLKADIIANWGVGEKEFARRVRDSYLCSDARLMSIYRTEVHIAATEATRSAAAQAGMKRKRWMSVGDGVNDGRVCPFCMDMNGEEVPIDQPYSNGSMTAHAHPSCRCVDIFS
jgi:SPP1 gp7 family putative phage head morphogenesis protein